MLTIDGIEDLIKTRDELTSDLRTAADQVEALSKDLADHKQLLVIKNRQLDTMTADNQRLRKLLRECFDEHGDVLVAAMDPNVKERIKDALSQEPQP